MKQTLNYLILILVSFNTYWASSQITITDGPLKQTQPKEFDSTQNFVGANYEQYIGQVVYVKPLKNYLRSRGYNNVVNDPSKFASTKGNTYKEGESGSTHHDSLASRYLDVIDAIPHPNANSQNMHLYSNIAFLQLVDSSTSDTLFWKILLNDEWSFPFLVVGHFEYLQKNIKGERVVFQVDRLMGMEDANTGKFIRVVKGLVWECLGMTLDGENFDLMVLLGDSLGQRILIKYPQFEEDMLKRNTVFKESEARTYLAEYGELKWGQILEGKIEVGFTTEMVLLSWGEPDEINTSSTEHQWVYQNKFLYFKNGVLVSFN